MAVLYQRVSLAPGTPLGFFNEEKKNLNCVELLYLLLFFFKDKLVHRMI